MGYGSHFKGGQLQKSGHLWMVTFTISLADNRHLGGL